MLDRKTVLLIFISFLVLISLFMVLWWLLFWKNPRCEKYLHVWPPPDEDSRLPDYDDKIETNSLARCSYGGGTPILTFSYNSFTDAGGEEPSTRPLSFVG